MGIYQKNVELSVRFSTKIIVICKLNSTTSLKAFLSILFRY